MDEASSKELAGILKEFLKDDTPLAVGHPVIISTAHIRIEPDFSRASQMGFILRTVPILPARSIEVGEVFEITLRQHLDHPIFLLREEKQVPYLVSRSPGKRPKRWQERK